MIKCILIVNNHGKPRIAKFYSQMTEEEQQKLVQEIYTHVSKRADTVCNFLEGSVSQYDDNIKLIYRHYATLYFVFAVDTQESDLGILDLIQVFVETLDKCFENVCELDLIFHSDKVHFVIDEIVQGGLVLETNIQQILTAIQEMSKLESASLKAKVEGTDAAGKRPV